MTDPSAPQKDEAARLQEAGATLVASLQGLVRALTGKAHHCAVRPRGRRNAFQPLGLGRCHRRSVGLLLCLHLGALRLRLRR